MLNDLNERIANAKARLREERKLVSMLRSAQQSLSAANSKRAKLKRVLAKEQSDFETLEGLSLTALFHTLLGNKAQRLDKERKEFLAAKLKFDQADSMADDLLNEVRRMQDEVSQLQDADSEYERVLAEKSKLLSTDDSEVAEQLCELTHEIADLTADRVELDEAVVAGRSALNAVAEIEDTLSSAANWGKLDMLGGGMLVTMAKHSKMDAAKNQARTAQRKLLQFEQELADADQRLQVSLQIDGFSKFADYFLDGLIADWIVQSKIKNATAECTRTISRVKVAIDQCQTRLKSVNSRLQKLNERQREIIETA